MKLKLIFVFCIFSPIFFAYEQIKVIEIGQTWYLDTRSSKNSLSSSKVLYYFSNDAYNTYKARVFSDWDNFSMIDSRNLVKLNKGDRVKILNSKHFEKIYEVELLDGFEKNRKYYAIKDDILDDFKLTEIANE